MQTRVFGGNTGDRFPRFVWIAPDPKPLLDCLGNLLLQAAGAGVIKHLKARPLCEPGVESGINEGK